MTLILLSWFCVQLIRNKDNRFTGINFIRYTLCLNTFFYFYMNWSFFNYPWPWMNWTTRTPSGLIFIFCTIGILVLLNYYDPNKNQWKFRKLSNI